MSDKIHAIINCETGEVIERPYTKEELAQFEKDTAIIAAQRAEEEAQQLALAETKASAFAKLAELGLTEEEAKIIAG